jgi:hypothetical protein
LELWTPQSEFLNSTIGALKSIIGVLNSIIGALGSTVGAFDSEGGVTISNIRALNRALGLNPPKTEFRTLKGYTGTEPVLEAVAENPLLKPQP